MTSTKVLQLDQDAFDNEVLQSDLPVLVDFWADWCQPCHIIAPTIDALADDYEGRVKVAKLDVDANQELAMTLGISSIPTTLLYRNGEIVRTFVGLTQRDEFAAVLDTLV